MRRLPAAWRSAHPVPRRLDSRLVRGSFVSGDPARQLFGDAPAAAELLLEVGELAARVLQEEPTAESEESGQEIAEQDEREQPDRPAVAGNEEVPVRDQEATLVEQVEPQSDEDDRRGKEGIGEHHSLPESLVLAEVRDRETQRVDRDDRVRNVLLDDKYQMRDVALAPGLQALVPGEVDLLEVDRRLVRGSPQVLDRDVLDRDIDLVAVSGGEGLDDLALSVRLDGRVGEPPVQEIERRRIVLPDRRLAPAPSARSGWPLLDSRFD